MSLGSLSSPLGALGRDTGDTRYGRMYYISQKEIFKGHMAKRGAELGFRLCYLKPSAHIFSLEKLLLVVVRRGVGGVR